MARTDWVSLSPVALQVYVLPKQLSLSLSLFLSRALSLSPFFIFS